MVVIDSDVIVDFLNKKDYAVNLFKDIQKKEEVLS